MKFHASVLKKLSPYFLLPGLMLMLMLALTPPLSTSVQAAGTSAQAVGGKWVTKNGKLRYRYADKTYAKSCFRKIDNNWYYFGKDSYVATGWFTVKDSRFYAARTGGKGKKGRLYTGWHTIKGKKYYFRPTGKKGVLGSCYKSEWVTINGQSFYFNSDGSLNTNTMTQDQFIDTIGKLASEDMKKTGILASVTTAQAILESGYGTSSLAMEAHNLFGMKAMLSYNTWESPWDGKTFTKSTKEYLNGKWYTIQDTFRAYSTFEESLADHSAYLTSAMNGDKLRYDGVVGNKSYRKTIKIIKKGGYATDPEYVSKICSIIKKYGLTKYDK